ncbi:subtilisin-like protease [Dioscorea cayenensis subsp. rotundata]|uniref:Subtilisin-like protease n=1 Tax=Dioscorea cayennensis subsp. rotundata TaxID=55577 RepID=A0AB40CGS5_DIOCR|nr:subtilisin-like protease [Dioscorea cayenensis subsp. rotundata]
MQIADLYGERFEPMASPLMSYHWAIQWLTYCGEIGAYFVEITSQGFLTLATCMVRHKDGREFNTGVADKKRKIWVPPGIGAPAVSYMPNVYMGSENLALLMYTQLIPSCVVYGILLTSVLDDQNDNKNSQLRTYIVHVQRPKHHELLSDEDIEDWHRSFLPNTSLDTGEPRLVHSYRHAISGFAARLTSEQVRGMESMEGFLSARPSRTLKLATTHTPSFLGFNSQSGLWPDSFMGSGVIIGVIDSGITPNHASFMDDGKIPPKPLKWNGTCGFHNKTLCNNKLIGAMAFNGSRRPSPKDGKKDGHGTHVAGIAAGNLVDNTNVLGLAKGRASGTAPKAHLATYKACYRTSCNNADIAAAIDEAIKNGVDILNLSLGRLNPSPFYDDDIMIATLSAVRAKIFVCMCAGNTGPFPNSLWNNGVPWILTVGASSHDRRVRATVRLGNGVELEGESGYQPSTTNATGNIIFPGFIGQNGTEGCKKNSFNNIDVKGKIVLCVILRGSFRDMSINVKNAGGVGMIVINTFAEGSTTFSNDYVLPTSHVNYTEARKIVYYFINSSSTATATIAFNGTKFGARPSPTIGYFSSRGPYAYNGGIIKPDILGPGVNILSAWPVKPGPNPNGPPTSYFNFLSGTSMASPHLAGIAALLKNTHKNWSAAAIRSAIMTTANRYDLDGNPILDDYDEHINRANITDMGSGQVNPVAANDPGLIYDINPEQYIQYLCGLGYNDTQVSIVASNSVQCSVVGSIAPEDLNYPSISIYLDPLKSKFVNRTLTNVVGANEVYNIHVEEPKGISVVVSPSLIQFSVIGEQKNITLEFSSKGMSLNQGNVLDGQLKLDSGKHFVRSPISVTIV